MSLKNSQVADQSIKGAVLGAVAYLLVKWNVDAEAQAAIITGATTVMAYLSTKVGDKNVASFLAKAAKEAPKVAAEVAKVVEEKKSETTKVTKKKAPAKKAAAKPAK